MTSEHKAFNLTLKEIMIKESLNLLIDNINCFAHDNVILKNAIPIIKNVASVVTLSIDCIRDIPQTIRKSIVLTSDVVDISKSALETVDHFYHKGIFTQILEYSEHAGKYAMELIQHNLGIMPISLQHYDVYYIFDQELGNNYINDQIYTIYVLD